MEIPLLEAEEMEGDVAEVAPLEVAEAYGEMAHSLSVNSVASLATLFGNATIGSIRVFRTQLELLQTLLNLHQLLSTTREHTLPLLPPSLTLPGTQIRVHRITSPMIRPISSLVQSLKAMSRCR